MKLAKPIMRDNGQVLIAEGAELSESILPRLAQMKIETITVQGNPVAMDGLGQGTSWAQRMERLDHLFRKHPADPWMGKVKTHVRGYFQRKAAAEEAAEQARREAEAAAEQARREAEDQARALKEAILRGEAPPEEAATENPPAPQKKGGFLSKLFKGGARG